MKTTTRKSTSKLPFNVPAPVEKALKTAGTRFDAFSVKAKSVALKTEKQVKVAAKDLQKNLQKKGQALAKDPRAFVEEVFESGRDFGQKLRANAGKVGGDVQVQVQKAARRAEGVAKNVTETVGTAVEKGLHSLNVPTRKELRSLSAKVDGLGKKIDALKTRKAPRAARRAR